MNLWEKKGGESNEIHPLSFWEPNPVEIYEIREREVRNKALQCDEQQFLCQVWHRLPQGFGLQKVGFWHMKSFGNPHNAKENHI